MLPGLVLGPLIAQVVRVKVWPWRKRLYHGLKLTGIILSRSTASFGTLLQFSNRGYKIGMHN